MIYPKITTESKVQIGDLTRLEAGASLAVNEAIIAIEISPSVGVGFIDVTSTGHLDWIYDSEISETVTVKVTTDAGNAESSKTLEVISKDTDNLFSFDTDLVALEDNIMSFVREGRDSYIDKHRVAQQLILDELDSNRIWKADGSRYVAADLIDIQDFKKWSIYLVLQIIFRSLSNSPDDIYAFNASRYEEKSIEASKRSVMRLDNDGDGEIDVSTEIVNRFTNDLVLQ